MSATIPFRRHIQTYTYTELATYYAKHVIQVDEVRYMLDPQGNVDGLRWYIHTYGTTPITLSATYVYKLEYSQLLYEHITHNNIEQVYGIALASRCYDIASAIINTYGIPNSMSDSVYQLYPETSDELVHLRCLIPSDATITIHGRWAVDLLNDDLGEMLRLCERNLVIVVEDYDGTLDRFENIHDNIRYVRCINVNTYKWMCIMDLYFQDIEALLDICNYNVCRIYHDKCKVTINKSIRMRTRVDTSSMYVMSLAKLYNKAENIFIDGIPLSYK